MLVSPRGPGRRRGTHIFYAESPTGPVVPVSPLPPTPAEFTCLDGTLYLILHGPNIVGQEHPILLPVKETPDGLQLVKQK